MVTDTLSTMNFEYSETQKMVAEAAREFAQQYIQPYVMEWDEKQTFPLEVFKKAGELGFMGVLVPEELGVPDWDIMSMWPFWKKSQKWILPLDYLWLHTILCAPIIFCPLGTKNKNNDGFPNWLLPSGWEHGDLRNTIPALTLEG